MGITVAFLLYFFWPLVSFVLLVLHLVTFGRYSFLEPFSHRVFRFSGFNEAAGSPIALQASLRQMEKVGVL